MPNNQTPLRMVELLKEQSANPSVELRDAMSARDLIKKQTLPPKTMRPLIAALDAQIQLSRQEALLAVLREFGALLAEQGIDATFTARKRKRRSKRKRRTTTSPKTPETERAATSSPKADDVDEPAANPAPLNGPESGAAREAARRRGLFKRNIE